MYQRAGRETHAVTATEPQLTLAVTTMQELDEPMLAREFLVRRRTVSIAWMSMGYPQVHLSMLVKPSVRSIPVSPGDLASTCVCMQSIDSQFAEWYPLAKRSPCGPEDTDPAKLPLMGLSAWSIPTARHELSVTPTIFRAADPQEWTAGSRLALLRQFCALRARHRSYV